MIFDPKIYGPDVARLLSLDGNGERLMPLSAGKCSAPEARSWLRGRTPRQIFPSSPHPEAALAGLWLYFSCLEESHAISQDVETAEGSFWHGILHRQEPDAANAAYWFRRVGRHDVFPILTRDCRQILERYSESGFRCGKDWDPFRFIDFCESARDQSGSDAEQAALEIQRAEWQILFDFCAHPEPGQGPLS